MSSNSEFANSQGFESRERYLREQYPDTADDILSRIYSEVRLHPSDDLTESDYASLNAEIDHLYANNPIANGSSTTRGYEAAEQSYTDFWDSVYGSPEFEGMTRGEINEKLEQLDFTDDLDENRAIWEKAQEDGLFSDMATGSEQTSGNDLGVVSPNLSNNEYEVVDGDYADFYDSVYNSPEFEGMSIPEINDRLGFSGELADDVVRWNNRQARQNNSQGTVGEELSLPKFTLPDFPSESPFSFKLSGTTGLQWSSDYNGNHLLYDEKRTDEAVECINVMLKNFDYHLDVVEETDKFFNDIDFPYSKLVPEQRFAQIKENIQDDVTDAYKTCMSKMGDVTDAIRNYSDGSEIVPKTTSTLNQWLYSPTRSGGDDPGSGPIDEEPNKILDDSGIPDDVKGVPDDTDLGEDDNLVIPDGNNSEVSGSVGGSVGGSVLGSIFGDETVEERDSIFSSEDDSLLNNLETSLGGSNANRFFVPSLNSTVGSTDGVKSSSAIGAIGVVAAATLAVGGKILHDKKHDDENTDGDVEELDDEETDGIPSQAQDESQNDDSLEEMKTGNNEINFDLDSVKFKNALIGDSEVND